MSNDNGLVDEYEKLAIQKKEIEQKEIELKNKLFQLAKEKNTNVLFGINKKCLIKEYEKVIFPDDKTEIVELIKKKGLYEKFSSVNSSKRINKFCNFFLFLSIQGIKPLNNVLEYI